MAEIIAKYSDYVLQSVEYFITQLETEIAYRDIAGLTNDRIEILGITKEHPLAKLMAAQLSDVRNADAMMSSIIPAISVTPGNMTDDAFTVGKSLQPETIDDDFIDIMKAFLDKTDRQIQNDVLISKKQIETITGEYKRIAAGGMKAQVNEWYKNEEINISVWSDSADLDILLGNLMDSMLTFIQIGFIGDDSRIRNLQVRINKGLTNFNFGRTLYGSEYNLTFLNSFSNYIIYTEDILSGHDLDADFLIPGES